MLNLLIITTAVATPKLYAELRTKLLMFWILFGWYYTQSAALTFMDIRPVEPKVFPLLLLLRSHLIVKPW